VWYWELWQPEGRVRPIYRVLSLLLVPFENAYRAVISTRSWAYDRRLLSSAVAPLPTLAIGNLTVGGTGKTPITAWFAARLAALGHSPAVVMRGYGGDEVAVHRLLNPGVPVYVAPRREAGIREAQKAGAGVAVLDDAFQHRAIMAHASLALVAAEDGLDSPRLLPRGPWREPLTALERATMVVTTRKAASRAQADEMSRRISELDPGLPQAQAHLRLAGLASYDERTGGLGELGPLAGFRCRLAVAGIAKPETLWTQLSEGGVVVEERRSFPDHHRYRSEDVERIRRDAANGPLIATLKDAVKLGPVLGREVPIHVPVQEVSWERGEEEIECLLAKVVASRVESRPE
jgi:tetraacyldisaccharide 4'-kinase